MAQEPATYEPVTDRRATDATLIEGLPGTGLVAAIAVDQVTRQLDLTHHGNIVSDDFPPVLTFQDGLAHDLVRVYQGTDPDVLTLQSDLALPPYSFAPLADCIIEEVVEELSRAIFIAGVPAESESRIGEVAGVATTDEMRDELKEAGVPLATDPGLVGGVTGAIAKACFHADVPAAVLVVRAHPFIPDPGAAQRVIEDALEPLVEFDIDTSELEEQAEDIRQQLQQLAQQYQQVQQDHGQGDQPDHPLPSMYQ